ncbi:MAG: hypothetical protein HY000_18145 [Planctomycetes bacterium]|nr:hypothetical protein [Planctomycetota bacterium]
MRHEPLSVVLPDAIEFAKRIGDREFERWCRLELYGYGAQGGMQETDTVPDYRAVTGRWIDGSGRVLDLSAYDDLSIVNRYRFRSGVKMLEELAKRTEMQNLADDSFRQLLRQHVGFDAARFCFNPVELVTALDLIKNMLAEKLRASMRE